MAKTLENKGFACPKNVQKKFKKKLTSPCCFGILIPHTVTTKQKYRKNMRTKTLLIAAAALAAGILASSAQTYSQNIVGYVNQTFQPGIQLIANPLNNDTNGANEVLPTLPDGSLVYVYSAGSFTISESFGGVYYDPISFAVVPAPILTPGTGVFVNNAGSVFTNTYTGSVIINVNATGTNQIASGFSLLGSQLPIAGGFTTVLNFTPPDGSLLYLYSNGNWSIEEYFAGVYYDPVSFATLPEPTASISQGFFVNSPSSAIWTQTLTP
jgi:hypothetical protein